MFENVNGKLKKLRANENVLEGHLPRVRQRGQGGQRDHRRRQTANAANATTGGGSGNDDDDDDDDDNDQAAPVDKWTNGKPFHCQHHWDPFFGRTSG